MRKDWMHTAIAVTTSLAIVVQGCGRVPTATVVPVDAEEPQAEPLDLDARFAELQARLAADQQRALSEELEKYLRQQNEQLTVSWETLNQLLAQLEQRRVEIEQGAAKLTVPDSQIRTLEQTIRQIADDPTKAPDLRDLAARAAEALTAYQAAATTFDAALRNFAGPVMEIAAKGKQVQEKINGLGDEQKKDPAALKQTGEEIQALLGDASTFGIDAEGKLADGGILADVGVAYTAMERAQAEFNAAYHALHGHPGLTAAERESLDTGKQAVDEGAITFEDVALAVVSAAASTFSTWAAAAALGISLGPLALAAVFIFAFLSALLGPGGGPGNGSQGTTDGTTSAPSGSDPQSPDGRQQPVDDGSDANLAILKGKTDPLDETPVAGSAEGDWAFKFDSEDSGLFVYVEHPGEPESARKLLVVPVDTANSDLIAIRQTYTAGALKFGPLEIAGSYSARFEFELEGKPVVAKLTWSPAEPVTVPTVNYVEEGTN